MNNMEQFGSKDFDWGDDQAKKPVKTAPYLALVKHGSDYDDLSDPELHERHLVLLADLPPEVVSIDREEKIGEIVLQEVVPVAFPESDQAEVGKIRVVPATDKKIKKAIKAADRIDEITNVIQLASGGVAIVAKSNERAS